MKKTIIVVLIALVAIVGITYASLSLSYRNSEQKIAVAIEAKTLDNENVYTAMWEILVLKANVAEKYSNDFKKIYPAVIAGRYSHGGGQMMQWIQEHNPTFDTSMYKDVMESIEAQRETFKTSQTQLIDLSRQHNELLSVYPSKFFLRHVKPIKVKIVLNTQAKKAFETGIEEKMNLFSNEKDSVK